MQACPIGKRQVVLHTADIARNRNGFERLVDPELRRHLYEETNRLMRGLDFRIIAAAVHKNRLFARYAASLDPYHYCLERLLERFVSMLEEVNDEGTIVAESRRPPLDGQLYRVFDEYMQHGTSMVSGDRLRHRIKNMEFVKKAANLTGLQVADPVLTPIARYVMGKQSHEDLEIIRTKFRRSPNGSFDGWGLTILS
jgi:hypothetical protein